MEEEKKRKGCMREIEERNRSRKETKGENRIQEGGGEGSKGER